MSNTPRVRKPRAPKPYKPVYDDDYGGIELDRIRDGLLGENGLIHYATIGYFLQWFAAVELGVDFLLKWTAEVKQPDVYETMTRGLPPRSKCERLYAICKLTKTTLGPNLTARLDHFSGRICGIRNSVAHSIMMHPAKQEWIEFLTLSELVKDRRDDEPVRAKTRMKSLELFEHGAWLHLFSTDLSLKYVFPGATVEIDDPKSGLPKASGQHSPKPKSPASARRRVRRLVSGPRG